MSPPKRGFFFKCIVIKLAVTINFLYCLKKSINCVSSDKIKWFQTKKQTLSLLFFQFSINFTFQGPFGKFQDVQGLEKCLNVFKSWQSSFVSF